MSTDLLQQDLLQQLEQKVAHAVEIIELLRLQVEELEEENAHLKTQQEKWRLDLKNLLKRFDQIDTPVEHNTPRPRMVVKPVREEDFMTV